ncbi:protein translocase subunit SecD [Ilumatobacter sp.]|uniref:protein translocase subunit SecD n=1 Tax=Ilumatobacter sp. TaxID=1967498 RepID=UPI003B51F3D6
MERRLWFSLLATVVVVIGWFAGNLVTDNTPKLGLDLQGGASVILEPTESGATGDDLGVVRDLIRDELERTGIAEPDVRVQGATIVVDLPGVNDQQQALDAVDVSGIVDLRPVVDFARCQPAGDGSQPIDLSPPGEGTTPGPGLFVDPEIETADDGASVEGSADDAGSDPEAGADPIPDSPVDAEPVPLRSPDSLPDYGVPAGTATGDGTTDETEPASSDASAGTVAPDPTADSIPVADEGVPDPVGSTSGSDLLPTREGQALCVGPSQGTGEVFERGSAIADNSSGVGIQVVVDLRGGEGEAVWNGLAAQCFNGAPTCPRTGQASNGQLAIVLDDVIQSAPSVNAPSFDQGNVSITGQFTLEEANGLANILNRGAFPVEMEAQEARTVSPSAGGDSLDAAIIAGLIGIALVLTYLVTYYRWIALVILGGMTIWALTVFSAASFVSSETNYSLSLAGVTGIIVAVGVTVDSYVVFFERMKDEIRNGRTLRNAAPRSFTMTWRTIWSADLISVMGAAILFWLSVGSVRGFALFLGITTLCDLFVCYFFTRPAVLLLARSDFMKGRRAFGLRVAS